MKLTKKTAISYRKTKNRHLPGNKKIFREAKRIRQNKVIDNMAKKPVYIRKNVCELFPYLENKRGIITKEYLTKLLIKKIGNLLKNMRNITMILLLLEYPIF